jgi:hypothetical protein
MAGGKAAVWGVRLGRATVKRLGVCDVRENRLANQIAEMPVSTLTGLVIKLRVAKHYDKLGGRCYFRPWRARSKVKTPSRPSGRCRTSG